MNTLSTSRDWPCRPPLLALAVAGAFGLPGDALAFPIDTGNPDFAIRWDNTFRYNLGVRARDCDPNICGNGAGAGDVTAYQSDAKFGKAGDVVTNRLDVLSEFDLVYAKKFGFRVSGAAWYDAAYSNSLKGDAALDASGAGQGTGATGGPYTPYTKRWSIGPSGEFLDAFVFGKFQLGDVPVNIKAGQHTIYWGESLFSFVGGVAYGQGPVDIRKAQANPGIEAKEVFLPLNQLSFSTDITDRITVAGQYFLDWKPSTLPEGGTYFGAADGLSMGGGGSIFSVPFGGVTTEPAKKRGDFGLALKWRPQWLDGTAGFYYREYTDKLPQLVMSGNALIAVTPFVVPTQFGLDYSSPRAKMYAFSLSKQLGDTSVGMDLTYRKGAQLVARPFATPAGNADLGAGPVGNSFLPTGDVVAGVVNAIAYFGKSPLFDSAALQAELNFAHLVSVKVNPGSFYAEGYNCPQAVSQGFPYGCATKNAVGMAAQFEPKWFQVWSGVDVSMPLFLGVGLHGNSAVPFGDNQGQGSYSIGATADIGQKYNVSLKYNGYLAKHDNDSAGALSNSNASLGKYWDRNWVSLTFKTTF